MAYIAVGNNVVTVAAVAAVVAVDAVDCVDAVGAVDFRLRFGMFFWLCSDFREKKNCSLFSIAQDLLLLPLRKKLFKRKSIYV